MPVTAFRVLPPDNSEYESGSCAPQQMVAAKCRNGSIATLPIAGWRGSYAPLNDQTGDLPIRRNGPIRTFRPAEKLRDLRRTVH
jgi:hypothetical protein